MPLKAGAKTFDKLNNINSLCPVCGKEIRREDDDIEYSKTRRGSHIFIHTECVKKWGE